MRLADLVTGKDNKTHDLGRWSWLGSFVSVIGGAAWNAAHGAVIDIMVLAQALGVIVAAHGAALWAKKETEPSDTDGKP
ncbi:hypothetical protein UFOVP16_5 [uncultured Caudovirales phage]|uniref:Uncharacterized protein n=1 Tax=uncultured Caudovirales phage TaxID=2100421 RepID=A0A6J5KL04_9CAUD|nr:hypothetical protein UFOVP16_5 [uncultured Caudovirales phage]